MLRSKLEGSRSVGKPKISNGSIWYVLKYCLFHESNKAASICTRMYAKLNLHIYYRVLHI